MDKAQTKAPARSLVSIDDVGAATAFLALDGPSLSPATSCISTAAITSSTETCAHSAVNIAGPILRRGKAIHSGGTDVASISRWRNRQRCNIAIHALVMVSL